MAILDLVNIETIIRMLGLNMKEHSDYFLGSCPFHEDKNPSFSIKKAGFYKCFSCSEKGSINSLVWKLTGQSIYKFLGIKDIASYYFQDSLKNNAKENTTEEKEKLSIKGNLLNVEESPEVIAYLRRRNVSTNFIKHFNISYSKYFEANGTRFRNRIMIPIYQNGKLIGYEGRDYSENQKPKVLYNRGCNVSSLFNVDNLFRDDTLIVCEGTWDIPLIFDNITENVTHTFGASITPNRGKLFNQFESIIYFQDNDEAGDQAVKEVANLYNKEFLVATPSKRDQDPGDLSLEEIKECVKKAIPSIEYFLNKSKLFEEEEIKW